ncbi:hypothetical protein BVG16_01740 [Paenibacillus selenitireducens]|uniref:Uncharacterized protein n=1 Tax=Paenibacillus selenitireducens TaxID=1324314 RepID=A0A1T2XMX4_9BACL|nr:hypothetical protein [Paenibacillus selenitireducens]OPA81086.1 hypothetical protein BVG16_01740 [Paenibacillus selenitireducens]
MPFVLQHAESNQIFSCSLINGYDLPYYGVKSWEDEDTANAELPSFLIAQHIDMDNPWKLIELEEHILKLCNVKAKNDSHYLIFLDASGRPYATRDSS